MDAVLVQAVISDCYNGQKDNDQALWVRHGIYFQKQNWSDTHILLFIIGKMTTGSQSIPCLYLWDHCAAKFIGKTTSTIFGKARYRFSPFGQMTIFIF